MSEENNKIQDDKKKIISNNARIEKKTLKRKAVEFICSDKIDSIGTFLMKNVVGPSVKDFIFKLGNTALSLALYENPNGSSNGGGYIPGQGYQPARRDPYAYNSMSNQTYAQPQPNIVQPRIKLEEISFASKDDAYNVLDKMSRDIATYGFAKVSDYYNYCGITSEEDNWVLKGVGWYNLGNAHPVMCTNNRWIITFPPVQQFR